MNSQICNYSPPGLPVSGGTGRTGYGPGGYGPGVGYGPGGGYGAGPGTGYGTGPGGNISSCQYDFFFH